MNRPLSHYRSPRIHVAGNTSVLLKGFGGLVADFVTGLLVK